jgi:hypothetical protein
MTRPELSASLVKVRLRPEDAEALLEYCEAILDEAVGPHRWIWWRIRQACMAALTAQEANHVVDRHLH